MGCWIIFRTLRPSYAFCQRFPDELTSEIFEHILNKALNNRMLHQRNFFIEPMEPALISLFFCPISSWIRLKRQLSHNENWRSLTGWLITIIDFVDDCNQ